MRIVLQEFFYKRERWVQRAVLALILAMVLTSCFGGGVYHTVKKDETLWRIARTYDVKLSRLARANHIKDPSDINTGVRLYIPGAKRVLKVPPASTAAAASSLPSSSSTRGRKRDYKKYRGGFLWPVRGRLLQGFGTKNGIRNDGIDILTGKDAVVKAAKEGEVVYVGSSYRSYGRIIIIKHRDDIYTVYANNKSNSVRTGERVKKGDMIARAGATDSKDAFIHFEVREGKRPVNPLFFLP